MRDISSAPRAPAFRAALFTTLLVTFATPGLAQTASRVGCVDVVKIFNDYQLQRDLSDELQGAQNRLQAEAQQRQGKVDALQSTLQALDPQDPIYRERLQELLRMQIDNKVWFETAQASVTRELAVWSNNIYQDIVTTIADVARERGYELVFYREEYEPGTDPEMVKERIRRRKLVWASPSVDISDLVLQRLNSKYASQPKTNKLQLP